MSGVVMKVTQIPGNPTIRPGPRADYTGYS